MKDTNRRDFLKKCGLSTLPFLLPAAGFSAAPSAESKEGTLSKSKKPVNFMYDGLAFSPQQYLAKLNEINKAKPVEPDFYGNGGETRSLEAEFARVTGKEKALYLPTGTMANQLAIKLLNGPNAKVIVPENAHIFRDEADAAQSVHNLRLVPIGKEKPYFELEDLERAVDYLNKNEVFKSGLGTVVIESPVRRADGAVVPIETIREVSKYCKENGYKLHLDGARLHLASAYTGIPVAEYASYFDTVYISLYKYLNAAGGAILCGDSGFIDQLPHQIKIHGGTVFQTWQNTSMALHYLNGIDMRWKNVLQSAKKLIAGLNTIDGISIADLANGTNIYHLKVDRKINLKDLAAVLYNEHNIQLGRANESGIVQFAVNESLVNREVDEIVDAWQQGVAKVQ